MAERGPVVGTFCDDVGVKDGVEQEDGCLCCISVLEGVAVECCDVHHPLALLLYLLGGEWLKSKYSWVFVCFGRRPMYVNIC